MTTVREPNSPDEPDTDGHDNRPAPESDPLADRARRLFQFLGEAQRLRTTPIHTVEKYQSARWTSQIPEHPAVSLAGRDSDPTESGHVLSVERLPKQAPPQPSALLAEWLGGSIENPAEAPRLRETVPAASAPRTERGDDERGAERLRREDHPEIDEAYEDWVEDWSSWAERELADRPVRELYNELFGSYTELGNNPESLELVLGVGCLSWQPDSRTRIKRHLLTTAAGIHLDDDSGTLSVVRSDEGADEFTLERDMLAPELLTDAEKLNELSAEAAALEAHPLDRERLAGVIRRFVHTLDADGQYRDEDEPARAQSYPVATFAPAIITRKRSQRGIVRIFESIAEQLAESGAVPAGVRPLVDPDQQPVGSERPGSPRGRENVDEETFLPLPVNEKQLRVVRHVDSKPQTLVQGPPGTGKTHTTAALLAHLLAQGKRVLVTAHTDRALQEVRDKLPEEIKPLSVAVVGSSRQDMSDLRLAVDTISDNTEHYDSERTTEIVTECSNRIDEARRERARLHHELVEARQHETKEHSVGGYHGTLSAIAQQHAADAERYEWLDAFASVSADSAPPLNNTEIGEWHGALYDREMSAEEPWARQRLADPAELPSPEDFADLVTGEAKAREDEQRHAELKEHPAFDAVSSLPPAARQELRERLGMLADTADELARRSEAWMGSAVADVLSGRGSIWHSRSERIGELVNRCEAALKQLDPLTEVRADGDVSALTNLANGVLQRLRNGEVIKTRSDGTVKLGVFTAKWVKEAETLFQLVRVNGSAPTTVEQLEIFLHWAEAYRTLTALDQSWPEDVTIPAEDTFRERLDWHVTEAEQLGRVLKLGGELVTEEQRLTGAGLPRPDWSDLGAVRRYAALVDAVAAVEARASAGEPLHELEETLAGTTRWTDTGECVHALLEAVRARDIANYAAHHRRLLHLLEIRRRVRRRDELEQRLTEALPELRAEVEAADSTADLWTERLADFEAAWRWLAVRDWVKRQHTVDENELQARINSLENVIRQQSERLCATRAWSHAVAPERLGGSARADLRNYSNLVRRLGKGTGTHAERRRSEIREAMMRCRPSVPVWIMPIYRIAEQFRIQPDMFDVVVVDEASQAGLEAVFLQYMAPRMVVIGDDKQVSPMGVGLDQEDLRKLAGQYIADDRYRNAWQDPLHSLFDDAKMRYGGQITLTEHRRCVPEIIEFSNRIAYQPDNITLSPVRQYDADRLEPFRARHVTEGHRKGDLNEPEAEALVEEIQRCVADPSYDGKTFGVISLLGDGRQARLIERMLLERLSPQELERRQLRCGTPPDFQGAERDVIFLSMVEARSEHKRISPLTKREHVQRFNVAVSRAKDQVWLFHSVGLSELHNTEDMRYQLLEHCYSMIDGGARTDAGELVSAVSEDQRDTRFDSLFEQRVFNRLVSRGYSVIPQYSVAPYKIDLVVIGSKARLAVECDGDAWHGPEAYERDLARQRELERCGWTFHRIRESAFYVDQGNELESLWRALHQAGIRPRGAEPEVVEQAGTTTAEEAVAEVEPGIAPVEHSTAGTTTTVVDVDTRPTGADEIADSVVTDEVVTEENETEQLHLATSTDEAESDPVEEDSEFTDEESVSDLPEYEEHTNALLPPYDLTRKQIAEGLRDIVAFEGPVTGERLTRAYAQAYGGRRRKEITKTLNSAISAAVQSKMLVQDAPLRESGIKGRTFRLPEQPPVRVRAAGPRTIEEIPPRELATVLEEQASLYGWLDEKRLFRAVLRRFGWRQLTAKSEQRLRTITPLVDEEEA
ncbi:AAA domain-containing protein [Actinopolyspora sp. H202]|uniref:AAA domain-containing protein n=1 Tax=Actinopolyspora sp. H202 TaxID=1500456 RepID=UPI003EE719E3